MARFAAMFRASAIRKDAAMLWCAAMFLLMFCATASAEVYRCGRNGKLQFSDHACAAGQVAIEVAEPNSLETSRGDEQLAARYDRETAAFVARKRSEFAAIEKASRQRREREDRIRDATMHGTVAVGMSQMQVIGMLGQPTGTSFHESESGRSETWTFRDGNIAHTVHFKDGQVTSVSKRTAKKKR